MDTTRDVYVLIPAYNAAATLGDVIARIPDPFRGHIIVVDDGSTDRTFEVADSIPGVTAIRHESNRGYGGAQTTLYDTAMNEGAEVTVMLHSDGGHRPEEMPDVLGPVLSGDSEIIVGSRMRGLLGDVPARLSLEALRRGHEGVMPDYVFLANLVLSRIQNRCYRTDLSSFHDGYRACTAAVVDKVPYHSFGEGWIFDTEFLVAASDLGFDVAEVPVSTFYDPEVSAVGRNIRYGFAILKHALSHASARRRASHR